MGNFSLIHIDIAYIFASLLVVCILLFSFRKILSLFGSVPTISDIGGIIKNSKKSNNSKKGNNIHKNIIKCKL